MRNNYDLCFKTPQKRWIFVPSHKCRLKGKSFIEEISKKWSPPNYCYHFKSGGHVAAIKLHQGHKYIAKLDIKSFFPSITKNRICRTLKMAGFNYKKALKISEWSVVTCKDNHKKKILPYGFIQSQLIATLCVDMSALGSYLKKSLPIGVHISMYVDDIIISSNDEIKLKQTYLEIINAITNSGFQINKDKTHSPQLRTTAFNIDFDCSDIRITDSRFEEFYTTIACTLNKKSEAIMSYVEKINNGQAATLRKSITDKL